MIDFLTNLINYLLASLILITNDLWINLVLFLDKSANQTYWYIYNGLDNIEISGCYVLGCILLCEVTGITSIAIDYTIEDILKPRKLRKQKLLQLEEDF